MTTKSSNMFPADAGLSECPVCKRMVESKVHCKHCNAHMEPWLWHKNPGYVPPGPAEAEVREAGGRERVVPHGGPDNAWYEIVLDEAAWRTLLSRIRAAQGQRQHEDKRLTDGLWCSNDCPYISENGESCWLYGEDLRVDESDTECLFRCAACVSPRLTGERLEAEVKRARDDAWHQGFAIAAALVCDLEGSLNAHEVFTENGITWEDLKAHNVEEYDLRRIAKGLGQHGMRRIRVKKRAAFPELGG